MGYWENGIWVPESGEEQAIAIYFEIVGHGGGSVPEHAEQLSANIFVVNGFKINIEKRSARPCAILN